MPTNNNLVFNQSKFFTIFPISDSNKKDEVKKIEKIWKDLDKEKKDFVVKAYNWNKQAIIIKNWKEKILMLNLVYDKKHNNLTYRNNIWQKKHLMWWWIKEETIIKEVKKMLNIK